MELITNIPRYSDGEVDRALMRELTTGLQLKKEIEGEAERRSAEEAKLARGGKEVPGLGRHTASIPQWEYYRMLKKYGHEEIHSNEFLKDFQKRFPHLAPNLL